MEYVIVTAVLFILMLVYFKIAAKYNIIDKPNHRSAHCEVTLRGGGVIFPVAFLFFIASELIFRNSGLPVDSLEKPGYGIFGAGLIILSTISFMDDLMKVSTKIRLLVHFVSVTLLLYFLHLFQLLPIWAIPLCYIFIIGILNAYNFMDGINGMSGLYTLVMLGTLWYIDHYIADFATANFIIYPLIATVIFLFFNFRKKAKCFLGDVGSMAIAFWILALLGMLMIETGQMKWILLLAVYGVDTILTIIERIRLKENIFDAHRRHLYQLYVNEKKVSHLQVSAVYAIVQLVLNIFVIIAALSDEIIFLIVIIPLMVVYLFLKLQLKKQISVSTAE